MSRAFKRCPRCTFNRPASVYSAGATICKRCEYGDFRCQIREYNTPVHMRLAVVFARVPLNAGGIMIALQQMQELPPPEQMGAA